VRRGPIDTDAATRRRPFRGRPAHNYAVIMMTRDEITHVAQEDHSRTRRGRSAAEPSVDAPCLRIVSMVLGPTSPRSAARRDLERSSVHVYIWPEALTNHSRPSVLLGGTEIALIEEPRGVGRGRGAQRSVRCGVAGGSTATMEACRPLNALQLTAAFAATKDGPHPSGRHSTSQVKALAAVSRSPDGRAARLRFPFDYSATPCVMIPRTRRG
jgi:hypothetical protein